MNIKDRLAQDLKQAMLNKDTLTKNTVTLVRSRIKYYEVNNRVDADDEVILSLIQKEIKQRIDTIDSLQNSGRDDLLNAAKEELKLLESYLPAQISDDDLIKLIHECINETGASSIKDMGKVIASAKEKAGATCEPKRISDHVKQILSNI